MKGIYVIAITSLVSWAVCTADSDLDQPVQSVEEEDTYQDGIPTVCPFPEPSWWNTTTNIPHETDCTKFYKCFLGKGVPQLCPLMTKGDPYTRLHYNRRLQVCDWPWQAGCASCPRKNSDGSYPPPSKIKDPNDNCRHYQLCINGQPQRRTCPFGCFSRTCQACVWDRAGGNCGPDIPTPTPTPTPTTPTPTPTNKCIDGDTLPHPCDCAKFYICIDGNDWYLDNCRGGLHYSPTGKRCMRPNEAGCIKK